MKGALLAVSTLTIMAASIVAPSLPEIELYFEGEAHAGLLARLILSLPAVFIVISAPIAGKLSDRRGRVLLLIIGLVLYGFSGSAGLYVENLTLFLTSRALLGVAIGLIMTMSISLVGDYFDGYVRRQFIGLQSAVIGIAGSLYLVIGGVLADISWRIPFAMYLAAILLIPWVYRALPEPELQHQSPKGAISAVDKTVVIVMVTTFVMMLIFFAIPTQLPFYLNEMDFNSRTFSGLALASNAIGMTFASLMYSRIKGRSSYEMLCGIGFLIMAVGFLIIAMSTSKFSFVTGMFINGIGIGVLFPNLNLWAIESADNRSRGRVVGLVTMSYFLGQFLSPLVFQPIVSTAGIKYLFVFLTGCCIVICVLYLIPFLYRALKQ